MKIFLLIHEEDTDTACCSDAKAFIDRQAARDTMQKEWNETLKNWMYDSKDHTGEDERECREDTAVIRDGGDTARWRIEEQELAAPVSVAVEVTGGMVQTIYARGGDVDADVFDLDVLDFPEEGEEDKAKSREKALNELINSPGWHRIW